MPNRHDFESVFRELRNILREHEANLVPTDDKPGSYSLNTRHQMPNKQPLFFGSVQTRKNYVSYYLMPVYVFPELLEGISAPLKKRMQGKSCFNFTSIDADTMQELTELTARGAQRYREEGFV